MKAVVLEDPATQSMQQHRLHAYKESRLSSASPDLQNRGLHLNKLPGDLAGQETVRGSSALDGNLQTDHCFSTCTGELPQGLFKSDSQLLPQRLVLQSWGGVILL